ncbi:MAG: hypothetical protein DI539_28755 [Flavobacterium psychrophilum]|nr:MAG: hypothetical protein DI539_28755 [Flavobacterium psychrophilum]
MFFYLYILLGERTRGINRKPPRFPRDMWSCYLRTINGEDRTNNHAEAAHRRLQSELQMNHPSIWKFIDGLRKVQSLHDLTMEQFVAGSQPPKKRKRYVECDERILNIVNGYADRTSFIEYLRGVAHNLHME